MGSKAQMRPHWLNYVHLKLKRLSMEDRRMTDREVHGFIQARFSTVNLLQETVESAYKAGRHARVPFMIGNNSAEIGGPFVNASSSKEELFSLFGDLKEEAKAAYDPDGNKEFAEVQTRFNTDKVWAEPARFTAKSVAARAIRPTFFFSLTYLPP